MVMRSCSMALQLLSVCIGSYLSGALVYCVGRWCAAPGYEEAFCSRFDLDLGWQCKHCEGCVDLHCPFTNVSLFLGAGQWVLQAPSMAGCR